MPTTSPDQIWYPDASYSGTLVAAFSTMATSIQDGFDNHPTPTHAEYTFSRSCANATLTALNAAPTLVTAASNANAASYFTPTSTGITVILPGVYEFSILANLTTVATGRSFIAGTANSVEYRASIAADDLGTLTVTAYLPATTILAVSLFQTTAGTRTVTGRININYLGAL